MVRLTLNIYPLRSAFCVHFGVFLSGMEGEAIFLTGRGGGGVVICKAGRSRGGNIVRVLIENITKGTTDPGVDCFDQ